MSNEVFPTFDGLDIEIENDTMFKTYIQEAASGKEYRSIMSKSPLYTITFKLNFLQEYGSFTDLQTLEGFYIDRQGSYDNFLIEVPNSSYVEDELIGVADSVQNEYQIGRLRGSSLLEPIKNIKTLTNVKVNGVVKSNGSDYTVSSTGLITFASAPATGNITWTGYYYFRGRFKDDSIVMKRMFNNVWSCDSVLIKASLGNKI